MYLSSNKLSFKERVIKIVISLIAISMVLSFDTVYSTNLGYVPFTILICGLFLFLFILEPGTKVSSKFVLMITIYLICSLILNFISKFSAYSIFYFYGMFLLCFFIANLLIVNGQLDLFFQYLSDFIFVVALLSLFFWFFSSILNIISPSSSYLVAWGEYRRVNSFYGIYFQTQGLASDGVYSNFLSGSGITRNTSLFVEAVIANFVFSIGFILNEKFTRSKIKRVTFLFAILSTLTTTGMIVFFLFVLYIIVNLRSNNGLVNSLKVLSYILMFLFSICIIVILIRQKVTTISGNVRSMKFNEEWNAFLNSPIFGNGINLYTKGSSNATMAILADGGIILFLLYYFPALYLFFSYLVRLDSKTFLSVVVIILLFSTVAQYTFLISIFISISWINLLYGDLS